jgi:hypothetical protein
MMDRATSIPTAGKCQMSRRKVEPSFEVNFGKFSIGHGLFFSGIILASE